MRRPVSPHNRNPISVSQTALRPKSPGVMVNSGFGTYGGQSVKSMQQSGLQEEYRYEDDCLYMNLEEEYLHRVSKRLQKNSNLSVNRSNHNLKM